MWKTRAQYAEKAVLERLEKRMGRPEWLPMRLMLETGVRVGDAVKARRRDFYVAEGRCFFRWTAEKTGKDGAVEISRQLYDEVDRLRRKPASYVFPGRRPGKHITRQALWRRIKVAAAECGLDCDGLSPHSLRKVYAVRRRREDGFRAAKAALQHSHDDTAAIYAYADRATSPDQPIVWGELELLAAFIVEKIKNC